MIHLFRIPINSIPLLYVRDSVRDLVDSSSILLLPTNRSIKESLDIGFADADVRSISEFFQDILCSSKPILPVELREYYLYKALYSLINTDNGLNKDIYNSYYFSSDFIKNSNYFNFINRASEILSFFRELIMEGIPFSTLKNTVLYHNYSSQIDALIDLWDHYKTIISNAGFIDEWSLYQECCIDHNYITRYDNYIFIISGYLTFSELNIFYKLSLHKDVYIFFNSTQSKHPQEEKIERILNSKFISSSISENIILVDSTSNSPKSLDLNTIRVIFGEVTARLVKSTFKESNYEEDSMGKFISIRSCDSDGSQYDLITKKILQNHYERGIPFNKMLVVVPDTQFISWFISSDYFKLYNISSGESVSDMDVSHILIAIKDIVATYDNCNIRIDLLCALISHYALYDELMMNYILELRNDGAIFVNLYELKRKFSVNIGTEIIFSNIISLAQRDRSCSEVINSLLIMTQYIYSVYMDLYSSYSNSPDIDSLDKNHFNTIKLSNVNMQLKSLIAINQELEKYAHLYEDIAEQARSSEIMSWILNKVLSLRIPVVKGEVSVIGVLETRNLQFDYIYIANLNRDIFPVPQDKDIFLDSDIRKTLGLPTRLDRQELQKEYLYQIIFRAKEVLVTYSEDDNRRCSSFINDIAKKAGLSHNEMRNKSSIYTSKGDFTFQPYLNYINSKNSVNMAVPSFYNTDILITQDIRNAMKSFQYSATSLQCLMNCGIKFYYTYLLNIRPPYRSVEDAAPYVISNAIHSSMNSIFRENISPISPLYKDKVLSYFYENIKKFDYFSKVSIGKFQAEELCHEVSYLVEYEKKRFSQGYRTIASEAYFKNNLYEYSITGVVDRIDKTPPHVSSGGLSIIDYKYKNLASKGVLNDLSIDKYDIQLPFYALLVDGNMKGHVYELLYYDIKNASGTIDGFPINRLEDFKSYILDMLELSINQDIFKSSDSEDVCKYCGCRMFCSKSLYDDSYSQ